MGYSVDSLDWTNPNRDFDRHTYTFDRVCWGSFGIWGPNFQPSDEFTMHGNVTASISQKSVYVWASGTDSTGKPIPALSPPTKAYFRLRGNAYSNTFAQGEDAAMLAAASSFSCTADDGLGDAPVTTSGTGAGNYINSTSTGSHLVQKDGSSGTVTFSFNPSAHTEGMFTNPWGTPDRNTRTSPFNGSGQTNAEQVNVDPAAAPTAMITSSVDTSYHKGSDGKQQPNLPSADGSDVTGDSAAGWDAQYSQWAGHSSFQANVSGFDTPVFHWTPGGNLLAPCLTSDPSQIDCTFGFGADASGSLSSTTTSCDVSDSNGMDDTVTYSIQWHLPYEKSDPGLNWGTKEIFDTRISGLSPASIGILAKSAGGEFPIEATVDGVATLAEMAKQPEAVALAKVIGAVLSITQWVYSYNEEPEVQNGARNDFTSWQVAQNDGNTPPDLANNSQGWLNCNMDWCRVRHESGQAWYADLYDSHGYNSPRHVLDGPNKVWFDEEPFFEKVNP